MVAVLKKFLEALLSAIFLIGLTTGCGDENVSTEASKEFLNVANDPTRELYEEYNKVFRPVWREVSGEDITFEHTHGASSSQAISVINGVDADVVSLSLAYDVYRIEKAGLIRPGWMKLFPNNSAPYTSTMVFLVRRGNPKGIRDWDDLIREDVSLIALNPKISGGARWNYLAAWEYARHKNNGDDEAAREFVRAMYANVDVLNNTSRETLKTFIDDRKGDALIAWENEALRIVSEMPSEYEIVTPSISILAEPSMAVVDVVVDRKGTRRIAEEYIRYMYSPEGQEIAAKYFYRPRNTAILARYSDRFKPLVLVSIADAFGDWKEVQKKHFDDGGIFDQFKLQQLKR